MSYTVENEYWRGIEESERTNGLTHPTHMRNGKYGVTSSSAAGGNPFQGCEMEDG